MSADVVDLVERLDEQAVRISGALGDGEDGMELLGDAGQALYNSLPEPERRALFHLAVLGRGQDHWPDANLIASVAQYHSANVGACLAGMGWTPAAGRLLTPLQRHCLALSRQILLGVSFEEECGEPAGLTSAGSMR